MDTKRILDDIKNDKFIVVGHKNGTRFLYYNKYRMLIPLNTQILGKLKNSFSQHSTYIGINIRGDVFYFNKLPEQYRAEIVKAIDDIEFIRDIHVKRVVGENGIRMIKAMGANVGVSFLPASADLLTKSGTLDMRALDGLAFSVKGDYEVVRKSDINNAVKNKLDAKPVKPVKSVKPVKPSAVFKEPQVSVPIGSGGKTQTNSKSDAARELLDCDKIRCNLPSYPEEMLNDIRRGHWEVFEQPEKYKDEGLMARDPHEDIRESGIIGIDFGTKSTVVVKQEGTNEITPIRIGASALSSDVKDADFENPTIISLMNIDSFLKKYSERTGRPFTSCEDIFVSYNALSDFRNCSTEDFYAFFSDLKQWSNNEKTEVVVRDKRKNDYKLSRKNSIDEKLLNPIEIYAYYIGLYINNMINGVFLRYTMSFPVKYSKKTKEFIRQSFENGIRKSLPKAIADDEEIMKNFSVQYHISEPAAYAVTALERGNYKPESENEKYLYGIFDFGGGTTDFDYGIWRGASDEEYDELNCDYVLECFGADSDERLGGENILESLAYHVFKDNKDMAADKKIVIALPYGERAFIGGERLVDNSRSANRNLALLKESFRPLWEQHDNWESNYSTENEGGKDGEYYAELQMYDSNGNAVPNCKFKFNANELIGLIKERITSGVDAFFRCMERPIQKCAGAKNASEKVHIFLAGNSSRSAFVQDIFADKIAEYTNEYNRIGKDLNLSESNHFELIPPPESNTSGDGYEPNIKTGVAYGLVKSRPGGKIFVKKNYQTDSEEETRFSYYLGTERREKFVCKLSPVEGEDSKAAYNNWHKLQGAKLGVARIYYTNIPGANVNEVGIKDIPFREIHFEPADKKYVFIRAASPTSIEYAIADTEENIGETNTLEIN